MTNIVGEIRNAVRALARTPSFAIPAIICIALGIGATTAIASAVSRALLSELPYDHADQLVAVHRTTPTSGPEGNWPHSVPNYRDLADRTRQLSSLAALSGGTALIASGEETKRVARTRVTGNLFATLGVNPQKGRLITSEDDRPESDPVVVISDKLWRSDFGASATTVGSKLLVDGSAATIVGVLPPAFRILSANGVFRGDLWTPIHFTPKQLSEGARDNNFLSVLGRLAPHTSVQAAQTELRTIFRDIVTASPKLRGEDVRVAPLASDGVRSIRLPLLLLFGAVCMVLLIAATNVAALQLARGVERQRETAVRVALGGSRTDVMRPVFVESIVLAAVGTVIGVVLAAVGARLIGRLAAANIPQLSGLTLDGRALAFAIVLAVGVGMVCAAVPAWRTASVDPQQALRSGRGTGHDRAHANSLRVLVVAEIGLSLVLLIGAGLVLQSFAALVHTDPGFEANRLLSLQVTLSPASYEYRSPETTFMQAAAEAIAAIPGVEAAGSISLLPYANWGNNFNIRYEGQPGDEPSRMPIVESRIVTPGLFAVTKQRLLAGRLLQSSDHAKTLSVAVVNKALVDHDFQGSPESAIGKRYYATDSTFTTIVGVVSDIRNVGPFRLPAPEVYATYEQGGPGTTSYPIMVRVAGTSPAVVTGAVRAAIHAIDPMAAVSDVRSMPEVIDKSLGQPKFYLSMLGAFAVVAVVLAVSGLYGTLSYSVVQRTRELGIRAALGSSRGALVWLVTQQGLRLIVAGLGIGLLGGLAATRVMTFMLFGFSALDPAAWVVSTLLLAVAGTAAAVIPAAHAAGTDPLLAIRSE